MTTQMGETTPMGPSGSSQQGPPAFIEFALGGKRLVRYNRLARSGDTDAAVLGKGGFGCVYRYSIDTSFTPPSSMDFAVSLQSTAARRHTSDVYSSQSGESPQSRSSSRSHLCDDIVSNNPHLKPASLVAVKLCRTPCSGSFDELQKTSLVDKKTRRAEMQDDTKAHVRIVRGEGRIFQYLQAAHQASGRSDDPPLVKLLANLSPAGLQRETQPDSFDSSLDEDDGPPTRLLVFEKLIEIDAERTAQGWTKSKKTWTHERVEKVAFEVIQGLQFLHEHNVTHGDLKPSNLMLDPRTGIVKIIDLGASRRFVHLSNSKRNNRCAVEEQDRHLLERHRPVTRLVPELCEGLGSLTGSPYYMAPEILLQATRYVDISGRARSVLEDYEYDYPSFLPREQWPMYQIGLSDLKRGWGIRADIWSWACTVQALLLKTVDEDQRPSSSTISPYDFSFSRHRDEMIDPLHEKSPGEDDVPRFHQWCRVLPLLIVRVALEPIALTPQAEGCSSALRSALKSSLRHQDLRPTADEVLQILQASRPSSRALFAQPQTRPPSFVTNPSPHLPNVDRLGGTSRSAATGSNKNSPSIQGHELESSRYATPPLSQGASTFGTPQQTCETVSRRHQEATLDRNQKAQCPTSTADSTFLPAPSREGQLSVYTDAASTVPIPQGFELVSPTRTPKTRTLPLRDSDRPATAGATLQPFAASVRDARGPVEGARAPRSHPSTPSPMAARTSPLRGATDIRVAEYDAQAKGQYLHTSSSPCPSTKQRGHSAEPVSNPSAAFSKSLGVKWPLEGMHALQLNSPVANRSMLLRDSVSVPASPTSHTRGASMPLLGTRAEQRGAAPLLMPPPATLGSFRRAVGEDIGGLPRCSVADSKTPKSSSLMATLKKKQVRLREGSKKLMGKRGSEHDTSYGHTYGYEQYHEAEHGRPQTANGSEAFGYVGYQRYTMSPTSTSATSAMPPFVHASPDSSVRPGGSSSRRSASRTGDDASPTKPLLRRLMTWGTTS